MLRNIQRTNISSYGLSSLSVIIIIIIIMIMIMIMIMMMIISESAESLEQIVPRKTKGALKFAQ